MAFVLTPDDLRCPTTGKRSYPTEASGNEYISRAWSRPDTSRKRRTPTRAYECADCGWWHLTTDTHGV